VHRHHSTIAARLAHAESKLGFSLADPGGRRRLDLAILLRHLRDRPDAPAGPG
jgi:DNA-binding PucR family transcriptional regulator